MRGTWSKDLDFLAARLHARRSRMAEGPQLDELCIIRNLAELTRAIYPGMEPTHVARFQRQLVQDLVEEMSDCLPYLDASAQHVIVWLLTRFQLEDLKILLRGYLNATPIDELKPRLVSLPPPLALDAPALMAAKNLPDFIRLLPEGRPRDRLLAEVAEKNGWRLPFFLEAALDNGFFQELLVRTKRLPEAEREAVMPLVLQEMRTAQFMFVVRGRFHHGLTAKELRPVALHRSHSEVKWSKALLAAADIQAAAAAGVGMILDEIPEMHGAGGTTAAMDVSRVEALAWKRYLRLANAAFRRSHMGVAAVVGYFGIRRVEIANLITLSEGIRLGVDERSIRARMVPCADLSGLEGAHV